MKRKKKEETKIEIPEKNLKKISKVIENMHFREYVDFIRSPLRTFLFSFLKGTGIGLGMLIGVALVITILTYIVRLFGGLPIVGEWFEWFGGIIGAQ